MKGCNDEFPTFCVEVRLQGKRPVATCLSFRNLRQAFFSSFVERCDVALFCAFPRYKNLKPLGFTSWGHPQLAAKVGGQPSILLWGKRDPHSDGIADIDLSYNQADEVQSSRLKGSVPGISCLHSSSRSDTVVVDENVPLIALTSAIQGIDFCWPCFE